MMGSFHYFGMRGEGLLSLKNLQLRGEDCMMRKKLGLLMLSLLMVCTVLSNVAPASAATKKIQVYLDGKVMSFSISPEIKNGVTFVQFRPLFEAFNYTVAYNNAAKRINANNGATKIQLTVGQKSAYIDGMKTSLSAAPYITKGSTLVPLRFVAEATGYDVKWNQQNKTIHISTGIADSKVKAQVAEFFKKQQTAENERSLAKAMQLIHPDAPYYEEIKEDYRDQFLSKAKVVYSNVNNIEAYGDDIYATVTRTRSYISGPFFWDSVETYEVNLMKMPNGTLRQYDMYYEDYYYAAEDLIGTQVQVPVDTEKAIMQIVNNQYQGFNEKNTALLLSSMDPSSALYEMMQAMIDEGLLKAINFDMSAKFMSVIKYTGNTAILYAEETDKILKLDMESLYYLVKNKEGNWLIYDTVDISSVEDEFKYDVLS